jgi:hypothetical protein
MSKKSLRPLALAFAAGGGWDTVGGFLFLFVIGTGRGIDQPPTHPFYAVFLGSFLLSFAYLQFFSAFNIRHYSLNVGCVIFGRVFYVIVLYSYTAFARDFPNTFWFTGVVDALLAALYLVLALVGGLRIRDIFLPRLEPAA